MINNRPNPHDPDYLDWEDNAASNSLAFLSQWLLPKWCGDPKHWTNRMADSLWAECSCCLFFRGAFVGACAVTPVAVLLGAIVF